MFNATFMAAYATAAAVEAYKQSIRFLWPDEPLRYPYPEPPDELSPPRLEGKALAPGKRQQLLGSISAEAEQELRWALTIRGGIPNDKV